MTPVSRLTCTRDTGVPHHLPGIWTIPPLLAHPGRGTSWETFVLEDIVRRERLANPGSQFYFWRTATGNEVDLLVVRGRHRFAIEIKSAPRRTPREIEGLSRSAADAEAAVGVWIVDSGGLTTHRMIMPAVRWGIAGCN